MITLTLSRIILVCWIVFLIYWAISARSAKPIERTQGWLGGNWYQLLLLVAFLLILNPFGLARINPLAFYILPPGLGVYIPAVILTLAGVVVAILARRSLAGNWSRQVAIKEGHELITTGLYRYIRNPIYTGIMLMTLGTAIFIPTLSSLAGFLVMLITVGFKLRAEEKILEQQFSDEYLAYKKHTWALIPFLW